MMTNNKKTTKQFIEKINLWKDEYLKTLNDKDKDEWYGTAYDFADNELGSFIVWLEEQ
jgi:hypothetical protein